MLDRLRQLVLLIIGILVGYALGIGPFAEWAGDVRNQLAIAWLTQRTSRGSSGPLVLLVAGFLFGQGLFLLARSAIRKIGPVLTRRSERLATWDPSLKLATRFGLHQYLNACTNWAREDPTARTQCLALFKVRGLGMVNEKRGTLATSRMLQRIAAELRAASVPENSSAVRRWLAHHFPKPAPLNYGVPAPRLAARSSGATFTLAFRELDAIQVVAIARDLFQWITKELASNDTENQLTVSAVVVVGIPGATARSLTRAASGALSAADPARLVRVVCDRADVRANVISQMAEVEQLGVNLDRSDPDEPIATTRNDSWSDWIRVWGAGVGCLLAAVVLLRISAGRAPTTHGYFPFPDSLTEIPVMDETGTRTVRLERNRLADQQAKSWRLTDALLIQGDPSTGPYAQCQVRLTVTNTSAHTFYVSAYDFTAVDDKGHRFPFAPERMLRMPQGISGRWLSPGESWTGWLITARQNAPVVAVEFEPDRYTRLRLAPSARSN